MDEVKKPSMLVAVVVTSAAVCHLIFLVLLAADGKGGLVKFQLLLSGLMAFAAIASWIVYFTKYGRFKTENQSREQNKE